MTSGKYQRPITVVFLGNMSVVTRYFSYGAAVEPSMWSVFRLSHRILAEAEGPNDGLVSVASSRWGGESGYKGTLMGVSHLDLINWTNRLKWLAGDVMGNPRKFNAIAFYLDIAGMKARDPDVWILTLFCASRYACERRSLNSYGCTMESIP